jgi:hypothetical protein
MLLSGHSFTFLQLQSFSMLLSLVDTSDLVSLNTRILCLDMTLLTLSQQGPIHVERARSMARSMISPIHIFGLVHAM